MYATHPFHIAKVTMSLRQFQFELNLTIADYSSCASVPANGGFLIDLLPLERDNRVVTSHHHLGWVKVSSSIS